jgi:hypothetical protein|tara:strand:- start:2368 stop:3030 length:663 start_codon:yes stop_codon:yes gene_type:complete
MKISNETRELLKNFSTINSGIKVNAGNKLETISNMKNILAVATVSESFPQGFSVYNLPEFLGATSLFEDPEYQFNDANLTISDSNSSMNYFYASEGMVTSPEKMITMPDAEISFDISSTLLSDLNKAASVLGVSDLVLEGDGTNISLTVKDKKNTTTNTFSRIVGQSAGVFTMNFKIENLKVLAGNYTVSVSSKGISNFKNKDIDLEYFIALEPDSKYSA